MSVVRFQAYDPKQMLLLPPRMWDWLPDDPLVLLVLGVVAELDLSAMVSRHGRPEATSRWSTPGRRVRSPNWWRRGIGWSGSSVPGGGARRMRSGRRSSSRLFGQTKACRGIRGFLLRGLDAVRAQWRLICAAGNLLKLFRSDRGGFVATL